MPRHTVPAISLPNYTTPFVGRRLEVAELVRRLLEPDCRLLTVVGPGGMGKTRLALAAAQAIVTSGDSALDGFYAAVPRRRLFRAAPAGKHAGSVSSRSGRMRWACAFTRVNRPTSSCSTFCGQRKHCWSWTTLNTCWTPPGSLARLLATPPSQASRHVARGAAARGGMVSPHHRAPAFAATAPPTSRRKAHAAAMSAASDAFQLFAQAARRASRCIRSRRRSSRQSPASAGWSTVSRSAARIGSLVAQGAFLRPNCRRDRKSGWTSW